MKKLSLLLLGLTLTIGCSKKEDAPAPNNPHVAGVWSGNGTDDAIGYYNITATLVQSGNQASGTFTMAGTVATINGNISMSFGAIGGANMGAISLQRTTWTVGSPSNANRVCLATLTITPGTGSISNTATAFHYSMTDCQSGTWNGGANMQKTAGTN